MMIVVYCHLKVLWFKGLRLVLGFFSYLDMDVWSAQPEAGLRSQHLHGFVNSTGQTEHQCRLVDQLVLIITVR